MSGEPTDLAGQWAAWGDEIRRYDLTEGQIRKRWGVSERRARTLRAWVVHGPPTKAAEMYGLDSERDEAPVRERAPGEPAAREDSPTPPPRREDSPAAEKESRAIDILVIGDAHAKPGQDFSRFEVLGRFAVDQRPDVVVCIGDWADMPSLSKYDIGKRSYEGRRYRADVEAANEALRLFHRELDDYNRTHPSTPYRPRLVWTVGNHEHRIDRATDDAAQLEGVISLDDLDFRKRGWEVAPFLQPVAIGGVAFAHYFVSGVMGRPVGGVNHARSLILQTQGSVVQGHSHTLHYGRVARQDGSGGHNLALVAGCYFEHDEQFAGPAVNRMYWRGLCLLRGVVRGEYDLELWGMARLRARWG